MARSRATLFVLSQNQTIKDSEFIFLFILNCLCTHKHTLKKNNTNVPSFCHFPSVSSYPKEEEKRRIDMMGRF